MGCGNLESEQHDMNAASTYLQISNDHNSLDRRSVWHANWLGIVLEETVETLTDNVRIRPAEQPRDRVPLRVSMSPRLSCDHLFTNYLQRLIKDLTIIGENKEAWRSAGIFACG